MLYPWLQNDYLKLAQTFNAAKFTALLLHGANNSGSEQLIAWLLKLVFCQEAAESLPCNNCSGCILYQEGNHPDYFILAADDMAEKKSPQIKVEQVREMLNFVATGPHVAKFKLIYIPECAELNLNSSNALLKVLEEPPGYCRFILQASNLEQVLPTLKSRCFKFQLSRPSPAVAMDYIPASASKNPVFWLAYFGGEPLFEIPFEDSILELFSQNLLHPSIENIFALSQELDPKKYGIAILSEFLLKWLHDLVLVKLAASPQYFKSQEAGIQKLVKRLDIDKLFALQADVVFIHSLSQHPLNHKLQFENLLFKYQQLYV